ncbi:MAG: hypothetical protein ACRYG8_33070 [Janthinobacterium lividum]
MLDENVTACTKTTTAHTAGVVTIGYSETATKPARAAGVARSEAAAAAAAAEPTGPARSGPAAAAAKSTIYMFFVASLTECTGYAGYATPTGAAAIATTPA